MTTLAAAPIVSHDFDFMVGRWNVKNRFLNGRLRGSHLWIEFDATYEFELLLNGLGNIDHFHAGREGRAIEGITLRLWDPSTAVWTLYWPTMCVRDNSFRQWWAASMAMSANSSAVKKWMASRCVVDFCGIATP